jgi:alcohol dehydrogenase
MKAVQINNYGDKEVLEINGNAIGPVLKEGQVLVEVKAASINPFDVKLSAGYMKNAIPLQFPFTMGGDYSGVVKEVNGVSDLQVGDEVYGQAIALGTGSGSFAELAAANGANTAKKPHSIDFEQAAALPLVGSSALQALEEHIKLESGQKILIHGGAGGIGHIAIQLAKALGAYVATTVSTDDIAFVQELGADEVIDYKTQNFEKLLKGYDAVFDTVGGETTNKSFSVLKQGGIFVSMLGEPDKGLAQEHGVTVIGQGTKINTEHLSRLAQLIDEGKITANVDKIFPLEQVKEAFGYQEEVHPRGKVVLKIA